jgi:hypothetical protein
MPGSGPASRPCATTGCDRAPKRHKSRALPRCPGARPTPVTPRAGVCTPRQGSQHWPLRRPIAPCSRATALCGKALAAPIGRMNEAGAALEPSGEPPASHHQVCRRPVRARRYGRRITRQASSEISGRPTMATRLGGIPAQVAGALTRRPLSDSRPDPQLFRACALAGCADVANPSRIHSGSKRHVQSIEAMLIRRRSDARKPTGHACCGRLDTHGSRRFAPSTRANSVIRSPQADREMTRRLAA